MSSSSEEEKSEYHDTTKQLKWKDHSQYGAEINSRLLEQKAITKFQKREMEKEVQHLAGVTDKKDEKYVQIKNEVWRFSLYRKEQKLHDYWFWRVHKLTRAFYNEQEREYTNDLFESGMEEIHAPKKMRQALFKGNKNYLEK